MRFVFFCHSIVSDWNNGNAHFLRGLVRELTILGHQAAILEPRDGWSRANLTAEHGTAALAAITAAFPDLQPVLYDDPAALDLEQCLEGAGAVLVHEWNDPGLVARLGAHRRRGGKYLLFFHDTHHRSLTQPETMGGYDLAGYDGVLAFGEAIREIYLRRGWARRAWTWHEAADAELFFPLDRPRDGDLVWIGNWGDEERGAELSEFLLEPVRDLSLAARIHGVRYPVRARTAISAAGAVYGGWLPNHLVPETFARFAVTVHVPRRPYVRRLPGIPTIRVFEALACGIPLVCAPWDDAEGLFRPGIDYLVARDGADMKRHLRAVLNEPDLAASLARSGLETVRRRHTCRHRAQELLAVCRSLGAAGALDSQNMEVA